MATGPGITLPGPDWTRPGMGMGHGIHYQDQVFTDLLLPGLDWVSPDWTG
jgi:hypothetical protein